MSLIKTQGKNHGQCNICGEIAQLTKDHVPPKGSVRVKQVEMFGLADLLSLDRPSKKIKGRKVQSGVAYKTICETCNNALGNNYDGELKILTTQTHKLLNSLSQLVLPKTIEVEIKPQKIMKAVIGHLCAVGVDKYLQGPHVEDIKEYVLNPSSTLPNRINIYYWVYPYKRQVLIRDAAYTDFRLHGSMSFWLMKFYPLSFMVVWDKPIDYKFPSLGEISKHRSFEGIDTVSLSLNLRDIPDEQWPEHPSEFSAICYGEDRAMVAIENDNKKLFF